PAWVSWRSGGGYYGWAPLGPSMSISVNVGIPAAHWVFVPQRYISSPRIYSYYTPYRNRVNIYNRTTIINNTYVYNNRTYVTGPRHSEVERVTRSRVPVRNISNAARPGRASVNNRSVSLYRPEVDRNSRSSARPSRVADAAAVRSNGSRGSVASRGNTSRASGRSQAVTPRGSSATRGTQTVTPRTGSATGNSRTADRTRATTPTRPSAPARAPRTRAESSTNRANSARPARSERRGSSRPQASGRSQS